LNSSGYSWSLYGRNVLLQSPSFKFSRKASSSYSLKLEPPNKQKMKAKRKPLSTPASPSRTREPQCTCMTTEQYARLRAQDPRFKGTSDVASLPTVYLFSRNHTYFMSLKTTLTNTNHNMLNTQNLSGFLKISKV